MLAIVCHDHVYDGDRAMVYRFQLDEIGIVIAEDLEPGLEPCLGLYCRQDIGAAAGRTLPGREPIRIDGRVLS